MTRFEHIEQMLLDKAIKHAEEVEDEKRYEYQDCLEAHDMKAAKECAECAEEHQQLAEWLKDYKRIKSGGWIPVSEKLPEHSYTKKFWLTVITDDGHKETLIGTWSSWKKSDSSKVYDAFNCWKDVLINGNIFKISQPIPKENVIAWMPAPEPYKEANG